MTELSPLARFAPDEPDPALAAMHLLMIQNLTARNTSRHVPQVQ